ncbi:MAG: protein-L-isoaspartate(D-aspartate) O-methyltransferase [Bacillota bacterium]
MYSLEKLVESLENKKILKTPAIKEAFLKVDRSKFILPEYMDRAYEDRPLPVGENQTISQPLTVAFMLELLQPQKDNKVLDVGSGSGWTTALLAEIVGKQGKVFAIERIKGLKEYGENNLKNLAYTNVHFREGNGAKGWPEHAPFDRILVNAAAPTIPPLLKHQLKPGGKLVIPLSDLYGHIVLLHKHAEDKYEKELFPGFAFVPFIDDENEL